ncbi:MAG TPA: hypothetical protein VN663_22760 [Ramlibacter sp.]|nr:hypothetical protein [Ramlibacter sp.]
MTRPASIVTHAWGLVFPADGTERPPVLGTLHKTAFAGPDQLGGYQVLAFKTREAARSFVHRYYAGRTDIRVPEVVRLRITVEGGEE